MKNIVVPSLLVFVGCTQADAPKEPASRAAREHPTPASAGQLAKPDQARVLVDLTQVRHAVRLFEAERGHKPEAISELDLTLHFEKDLVYDPASGKVESKTYPKL